MLNTVYYLARRAPYYMLPRQITMYNLLLQIIIK
jgi:hypothetical protein